MGKVGAVEVFKEAVEKYEKNVKLFVLLALVPLPFHALFLYVTSTPPTPFTLPLTLITGLLFFIASVVYGTALNTAVARIVKGRRKGIGAREAFQEGIVKVIPYFLTVLILLVALFAVAILSVFIILLPLVFNQYALSLVFLLLLILGAIYLSLRLAFLNPCMFLGEKWYLEAYRCTWAATAGKVWLIVKLFAVVFLVSLLAAVINPVLLFSLFGNPALLKDPALTAISSLISTAISLILVSPLSTLMFFLAYRKARK